MKYSIGFERDYNWFLKYKDEFAFDGAIDTGDKVVFNKNGKSAKECFFLFDSRGKIVPTNESNLLFQLHKAKGAINFQIKIWAEDRASGVLPKIEFAKIIEEFELLPWMIEATERQKYKYYDQKNALWA